MPEGLEQRVLSRTPGARTGVPAIEQRRPTLRMPEWRTMPRTLGALAAAAAVAMVALPMMRSNSSPFTDDSDERVVANDALQAEAELFEVVTASLSLAVTTDLRSLAEEAEAFEIAIQPDSSWLDAADSI